MFTIGCARVCFVLALVQSALTQVLTVVVLWIPKHGVVGRLSMTQNSSLDFLLPNGVSIGKLAI